MSTQLDLVPVKPTAAIVGEPETRKRSKWFRLLANDRVAAVAAVVLGLVFLTAIFGPMLVGNLATHIDLDNSNQAPFTLAHGWANVLGTDPLGRSMLARHRQADDRRDPATRLRRPAGGRAAHRRQHLRAEHLHRRLLRAARRPRAGTGPGLTD